MSDAPTTAILNHTIREKFQILSFGGEEMKQQSHNVVANPKACTARH